MAKIAVFDSGLGSLSIIKAMQRVFKADIIYFADQQNFPYGKKSQSELGSIIKKSIKTLQAQFSPDIIVVASNTPSLMLNLSTSKIIDVKPPLNEACRVSKSKRIGILGTKSAIKSKGLSNYIKEKKITKSFKIFKINGSDLVELVETGKFLTNKQHCKQIINTVLNNLISKNSIDTVTLSSTHLPFLQPLLKQEFPNIQFIDPGSLVAQKVLKIIKNNQSKRNSLKIFTSGDPKKLEKTLVKLKIKNKVSFLTI
ncbi:MAG: glutamate racemase [Nitrosopumilus sp.]